MASNNSNEWVREGTPREDWDTDTDYGVAMDPAEWDDYSQEQAVPVPTPAAARDYQPPAEGAEAEQADGEFAADEVRTVDADQLEEHGAAAEAARDHGVDAEPGAEDVEHEGALSAPGDDVASPSEEAEAETAFQPTADAPADMDDDTNWRFDREDTADDTWDLGDEQERPRPVVPGEQAEGDEFRADDEHRVDDGSLEGVYRDGEPQEHHDGEQLHEDHLEQHDEFGSDEARDEDGVPMAAAAAPVGLGAAAAMSQRDDERTADEALGEDLADGEPHDEVVDEHDPVPAETQEAEHIVSDDEHRDEVVDPAEGEPFGAATAVDGDATEHDVVADETHDDALARDDEFTHDGEVREDELRDGELREDEADVDPDATAQYQAVADEDVPMDERENLADEPAEDPATDGTTGAAVAGAGAAGAAGVGFASLYREDREAETDIDATQTIDQRGSETEVIDQSRLADEEAEEQARQARLQEQRDARDARLGIVSGTGEGGVRVVEKPVKRQADRGFGAFSLFLFRLVVAGIIGVLGYQVLTDIDGATEFLSTTVIPEPRLVAWILGFGFVALAALLVLGLGARLVGFLLFAVAVASLVTIRWGQFSIFQPGMEGFLGDRTLLTAVSGLVISAFGAGRASIDGAIHAARQKAKAARNQ